MDEMLKDSRFAHIAKDPKFRRIPRAERKVKIDKRFQSMFKDKKFTVNYTIDKRGRPVNQSSNENLRKYYELSSSEEESEGETSATEETKEEPKNAKEKKTKKNEKKKKKNVDGTGKQQKNASAKHDDINEKEIESEDENESEHESDDNDNCVSTNGELLRLKPKAASDKESSGESESDTKASKSETTKDDLLKNEKQLLIRRKNESAKIAEEVKKKLKDLSVNYARGEGVLLSDSSSSEEESSEYSDDGEEIDHNWGELDKEAETTDDVTHRLAACNMDWDRIRAVDLMVLFNSFLTPGGLIRSVTIYPSEFGLQRMKEEEVSGPIELTQTNEELEDDNEEGSEFHMEKLRKYQLNRLKYYYAVIAFDSKETANKIYTECDGIEYESTATKVDLRFIPDDMEFDQEPKEVCTEIPEFTKYQPRQFTTTALQQVKVELTWDEMNPERKEFTQKLNSGKIDEIDQNDLQAYLASETSDDEPELKDDETKSGGNKSDSDGESNVDPIEKYKSLLKEIEEKEEEKQKNEVELEFTWGLGAKEKAEKLVKERLKKDENLTPFEQYLEKRKAKKKAKREEKQKLKDKENSSGDSEGSASSDDDLADSSRKKSSKSKSRSKKKTSLDDDSVASSESEDERRKGELELLLMDENDDEKKQHFNMKKIEEHETMSKSKQKRLKKKNKEDDSKADEFNVDVKDPRFNALFTSHHYNIDPADPHYRKTKGTEALITEKLKRRNNNDTSNEVKPKQPKTEKKLNTELQALVKSVKKNAQNISKPIK